VRESQPVLAVCSEAIGEQRICLEVLPEWYQMITIEGYEYTLFWDLDRDKLSGLSFSGRLRWLRERIDLVLLKPIDVIVSAEEQVYAWMAVTELVCAGIDALAGFYGDGRHGADVRADVSPFCRFVDAFMSDDFSSRKAPDAKDKEWTYCQHLQKYFRDGLTHGFAIEWGGLKHAGENGLAGYLRPASDGRGIAICPRSLLEDFRHAVEIYFDKLVREGKDSLIGQNFSKRFDGILEQRSHRRI
jgi:hypothetical protein